MLCLCICGARYEIYLFYIVRKTKWGYTGWEWEHREYISWSLTQAIGSGIGLPVLICWCWYCMHGERTEPGWAGRRGGHASWYIFAFAIPFGQLFSVNIFVGTEILSAAPKVLLAHYFCGSRNLVQSLDPLIQPSHYLCHTSVFSTII